MGFDRSAFSPIVQQEIAQQGFELFNMPFPQRVHAPKQCSVQNTAAPG